MLVLKSKRKENNTQSVKTSATRLHPLRKYTSKAYNILPDMKKMIQLYLNFNLIQNSQNLF